jgi:phosphate-selective porin OprO/OprP
VKPNKDGSVEVAFRYSYLNLNDKDEHGGMQTDYTYGLNWYISKELKVMANYIVAKPKETDEYDGLLQIVQARILFAF